MQEILQQILVEVKGNKESVKKLEKQILAEVQENKESIKQLENRLVVEIQETKKNVNQLEKQLMVEIQETKKSVNQLEKRMEQKFKEQTSEISQEFKDIVTYFDKKFKKQDKVNEAMLKELRENRLEHESYNSRFYKIEVAQSNLKNQFNELAKQQGIAI